MSVPAVLPLLLTKLRRLWTGRPVKRPQLQTVHCRVEAVSPGTRGSPFAPKGERNLEVTVLLGDGTLRCFQSLDASEEQARALQRSVGQEVTLLLAMSDVAPLMGLFAMTAGSAAAARARTHAAQMESSVTLLAMRHGEEGSLLECGSVSPGFPSRRALAVTKVVIPSVVAFPALLFGYKAAAVVFVLVRILGVRILSCMPSKDEVVAEMAAFKQLSPSDAARVGLQSAALAADTLLPPPQAPRPADVRPWQPVAPQAAAYCRNGFGRLGETWPELKKLSGNFWQSADGSVLGYKRSSLLLPLLLSMLAPVLLAFSGPLGSKILMFLFVLIFPWFFYERTVLVLNAKARELQLERRTVLGTKGETRDLADLDYVVLDGQSRSGSLTTRVVRFSFRGGSVALSRILTSGFRPTREFGVIQAWVQRHGFGQPSARAQASAPRAGAAHWKVRVGQALGSFFLSLPGLIRVGLICAVLGFFFIYAPYQNKQGQAWVESQRQKFPPDIRRAKVKMSFEHRQSAKAGSRMYQVVYFEMDGVQYTPNCNLLTNGFLDIHPKQFNLLTLNNNSLLAYSRMVDIEYDARTLSSEYKHIDMRLLDTDPETLKFVSCGQRPGTN